MSLDVEIGTARKRIYRDGYDMSLGEIASLYEKSELVIDPEYQRLFRWDPTRRTRFIESLLLNIPIPPIFVFSGEGGTWELIDGLQRVSTVLEFMGLLQSPEGGLLPRFVCSGTDLLPSLADKFWPFESEEPLDEHISSASQISIRRARVRIEILGQETDAEIKYELFQRLNTGGANLSEQEIRNCIIISINKDAYASISKMSVNEQFLSLISIGEERMRRQYAMELVVRFLVLRHFPYTPGLDLHDYLDKGMVNVARDSTFDWGNETTVFGMTMNILASAVGNSVFRKNNRFSLAMFEFLTLGVSKAIERGQTMGNQLVQARVQSATTLPEMERYSGSGIRGTQRLSGLVPLAEGHFV